MLPPDLTRSRLKQTPATIILLFALMSACTSWHVGKPTPAAFLQRERPKSVRVTLVDSTDTVLEQPTIRGDTLFGEHVRQGEWGMRTSTRVALPLADVQSVAVRRFSLGGTLALVTAFVGAVLVAQIIECGGELALWC